MAKKGVKEEDIPRENPFTSPDNAQDSVRYIEVKGFAWFHCKKNHEWASPHSWCFVDLKTQTICYRDTQQCRECSAKTAPEFTQESLEKMAEFVVQKFLVKTKKIRSVCRHKIAALRGGHIQQNCGKCKRLGRGCWSYWNS